MGQPRQHEVGMKIQRKAGMRATDDRRQFQGDAQLSWQTRSGEGKVVRAKFLDLSLQGAGIECPEPIEPRTIVYLQAQAYGAIGNASVRYCIRAGLKFRIGVLFSSPAKWADSARQKYLDQREPQEPSGG